MIGKNQSVANSETREPTQPIDFVITWVDGADSAWQAERDAWLAKEERHPWSKWATGNQRYRDWGLLPYWFRGVEKFAPWVRKIHFVTWGHVPSWLNLDHPKLHVVRHDEFIPAQYLPTFSSRVIELNLHRIEGLAEQFVYFNDDMFLAKPVLPEQFFKKGLPCDFAGLDACIPARNRTEAKPVNAAIINAHFSKAEALRSHPLKWFNPRYGIKVLAKTLSVLPYERFAGIQINHLACSFRKKTFEEAWDQAGSDLDRTCKQRFRAPSGCNIWVMQDWARAKGEFVPAAPQLGAWLDARLMQSRSNVQKLEKEITSGRWNQVSINDECTNEEDFIFWSSAAQRAFQRLLPDPCNFELS